MVEHEQWARFPTLHVTGCGDPYCCPSTKLTNLNGIKLSGHGSGSAGSCPQALLYKALH